MPDTEKTEAPAVVVHPDDHPGAHLSLQTIFRYFGLIEAVIADFENLKALQPGETTAVSPTPLKLDVGGKELIWDLGNVTRPPAPPPVPVPTPLVPTPPALSEVR